MTPKQAKETLASLERAGVTVGPFEYAHLTEHPERIAEADVYLGAVRLHFWNGDSRTTCPTCWGNGYVSHDVHDKHPDFGKLFKCPDCVDKSDIGMARLRAASGLSDAQFREYGGDLWAMDGQEPLNAFVRSIIDAEAGWYVVVGPPGIGKTSKARWAIIQRVNNYRRGRYLTVDSYLDSVYASLGEHGTTLAALKRDVAAMPWLVCDELENSIKHRTGFKDEQLFALINQRYELRHERLTLWLMTPDGYSELSQGFKLEFDRMQEGVLWLEGQSVRSAIGEIRAE